MEDEEIIGLYFDRNEQAISATAAKYGRWIRSIAQNILRDASDSEECESDVYVAAWNRIPPQYPRRLAAFLGRMARNIALDRYDYHAAARRNRALEVAISELEEALPDGQSVEGRVEASELTEAIDGFLRGTSRTRRIVFVRRYWYCDSIRQIASAQGFSESKIKSMLMRTRRELKLYLERRGLNDE